MKRSAHLVFIGDVGGPQTYHVGDEAMLAANLATFRRLCPGARATVVSRDPAWTSNRYSVDSIAILGFDDHADCDATRNGLFQRLLENLARGTPENHWGSEAIAALAASDGLVVSGGGNLSATWPEHVYERAALAEVAHQLGKPVAILGQTIGPDLSPSIEPVLRRMLGRANLVGVRELCSASLALGLGVSPDRLIYQTDDALFLDATPLEAEWAKPLKRGGQPWIAVTVDPFAAPEAAAHALSAMAAQLSRLAIYAGARLVFIPHVASDNSALGAGADLTMGRLLASQLLAGVEMALCDVLDAEQVRWLTGQADLVVSTRYHPLVFGIAAGVPGLAVVTDEYRRVKLQGVLSHVHQSSSCLSIQQVLEEDRLFSLGQAIWDRRKELRTGLLEQVQRCRDLEASRWQKVLEALGLSDAGRSLQDSTDGVEVGFMLAKQPLARQLLDELEFRRQSMAAEQERLRTMRAESERYALSLRTECERLTERFAEVERYALSLRTEYERSTERFAEVERYALSLEAALATRKAEEPSQLRKLAAKWGRR